MKILYASSACSKRRFKELFPDLAIAPGQQVQKYHRLMMQGLVGNGVYVTALTSLPINRLNTSRVLARILADNEDGVDYHYLPIVNISLAKNVIWLLAGFWHTFRYLRNNQDAVLICDVLNLSVSSGALFAAKLLRRKNVGIVTDIPEFLFNNPSSCGTRLTSLVMRRYDSFVFLTHQMDGLVNQRNAPHVTIEGQVDVRMGYRHNDLVNKSPRTVCLYAGAINRRYGLQSLVEGFLAADLPDVELHIYGDGDYSEELISICKSNPQIKYFGVVENDLVVERQLQSTLLINPRPASEEFTKYSFPSKNMEYMASGTPLLTTLLPGMPAEYLPLVFVLEDETASGISAKLRHLLSMPAAQLHQKGLDAKRYVLEHKNSVNQARKLLEMLDPEGFGAEPGSAATPCPRPHFDTPR